MTDKSSDKVDLPGRDSNNQPVVLTIAGFDPSGGAGVVADVKTFSAFGCWAAAAITSLTFQNNSGVYGAVHQSAANVRAQVIPVLAELRVMAVKTGMLPTRDVVMEVVRLIEENRLVSPVVDPVVRSTSGYDLIDDDAVSALVAELLPRARVVTPNIPEAERITGLEIKDEEGMRRAALSIRQLGARAVVIKGGHLKMNVQDAQPHLDDGPMAIDLLDDNGKVTVFRGALIENATTHGTGCMFAAAIAACLGHALSLEESVRNAKSHVAGQIRAGLGTKR